ncbi:sulfur carrier protein ThiS [Arthrobacter sp. KK5.5]|uniref:sulfur carrier protein ThiS n=1 Tax=Arthrobacter sp. KK5.5 TaxID=3373084 RepID=UPI003EE755B5
MTTTRPAPAHAPVTVNGSPVTDAPENVLVLVARHTGRALLPDGHPEDGGRLGLAVALNGTVVPRSMWGSTPLAAGDRAELLSAVQGG